MTQITGYHAHVYFDEASTDTARAVCAEAGGLFDVTVGRHHEKCVGPHPRWSCQIAFAPDQFDKVIPWLMLNRRGLTVFTHPETGDALTDHRDRAIWMGETLALDLSMFGPRAD